MMIFRHNNSNSSIIDQFNLNWGLNFVDTKQNLGFDNFYRRRKFTKALLFINLYFTIFLLPTNLYTLGYDNTVGAWLFSFIMLTITSIVCIFGWFMYFVEKRLPESYDKYLNFCRRMYIIGLFLMALAQPLRNLFTDCQFLPVEYRNYVFGWHCENEAFIIPNYSIALLALAPIGAIVCLCETRLDFVLFVLLVTTTLFVYYAAVFVDTSYIFATLVGVVLSTVICVDEHQFHMEIYLAYDKLEETLAENRRMQEENRAAELRSMIGNLTHDLKTPLSSFMSGIDIMAHNISQIVSTMKDAELSMFLSMQSQFDSLLQCFKNIRNTNMFMLMTINRCLDYTKASKGLKLTPKYETVDLMETLSMPLQCMKNIQDRIPIEMEQLGMEICSHVITDKQWLQENILCLLSNAVKYSSDGVVNISVSLKARPIQETINITDSSKSNANNSKTKSASIMWDTVRDFSLRKLSLFSSVKSHIRYVVPVSSNTDDCKDQNDLESLNYQAPSKPINISALESTLRTTEHQRFLRFEISDHGIGLTEDGMKNLFSPFKQAQKLAGGTGLGLYSLAKRMDAIKGHYGVEPRRDGQKGSIFWFEIPYRADEIFSKNWKSTIDTELKVDECPVFTIDTLEHLLQTLDKSINQGPTTLIIPKIAVEPITVIPLIRTQNKPEMIISRKLSPLMEHTSRKINSWKILIAEDSPTIAKMISMMLRQQRHEVTLAENGEVAFQKMVKHFDEHGKGYDMVLMDLQMPVLDGLEATRRFRCLEKEKREKDKESSRKEDSGKLGRLQHQQIIVGMSANSDEETIKAAFEAGVNDFITKPFQVDSFNIVAKKLLIDHQILIQYHPS